MRRALTILTLATILSACSPSDVRGPDGREALGEKGPSRTDRPATGARPPGAAPEFSVKTFDGDRFTLAEHRGTPVVINFWESW